MRSVRIVDRGIAAKGPEGGASGSKSPRDRDPFDEAGDTDPHRPSVSDRLSYYWNGPGWVLAYNEARRVMQDGVPLREAAASVGWTEDDLRSAIARRGKPPKPPEGAAVVLHERPRRTVKQRVAGLKNVTKKTLKLARRYYEVECMTVREVARALDEPYEKCYLLLIKAGTRFRRPGRRRVGDDDS